MYQLIDKSTHHRQKYWSLLDLIFTNNPQHISSSGTLPPIGLSKHSIVLCNIYTMLKKSDKHRRILDYYHTNWIQLNEDITGSQLYDIDMYGNIDELLYTLDEYSEGSIVCKYSNLRHTAN